MVNGALEKNSFNFVHNLNCNKITFRFISRYNGFKYLHIMYKYMSNQKTVYKNSPS